MKQSEEMLKWAGDNWLNRNRDDLGKEDDIFDQLLPDNLGPDHRILEIGCANGWRLKKLKDRFGCRVYGVEPSQAAVAEAKAKYDLIIQHGIASDLPHSWDDHFDIVILGFCLWLIEPSEWFAVVAETDRVIRDNGILIIHDYLCPRAIRKPYDFDEELIANNHLWIYFYDWPKLWLSHPGYSKLKEIISHRSYYHLGCALRKNTSPACVSTSAAE